MATKRKTKANSVDGAVRAIENVLANPLPPPWPLSREQQPIWDEILLRRSRDEWQPVDLRFAWDLSEVLARLKEEKGRLHREGFVVETEKGNKPNPRGQVVRLLSSQARDLARYLRVHPASDAEHPHKVAGGRHAEQEARTAVATPKRATVGERRRARLLPMQ